ncbi:MAG TPA: hypothetical protein VGF75_01765 [Candidatus Saccharimonadales bacterium]|jgi:hypothetical protein
MASEVYFRDLPASSAYKCNVMLENKMQCQERASVEYFTAQERTNISRNHICKHHFAVERQLNEAEGTKYLLYTSEGKLMDETKEEFKPPQK